MEIDINFLVLKAADIGENDKLITVLTDKLGKIKIKLRGVKKAGAKFKFASQPFCFANGVVYKRGDFYTLISATSIDQFQNILFDYDRLSGGFVVLEVLEKLCRSNVQSQMLTIGLNALMVICYENCEIKSAVAKFLANVLDFAGYGLQLDSCIKCGNAVGQSDVMAIDLYGGGLKCERCFEAEDKTIKSATVCDIKSIVNSDYKGLDELKISQKTLDTVIKLYIKVINYNYDVQINSVKQVLTGKQGE